MESLTLEKQIKTNKSYIEALKQLSIFDFQSLLKFYPKSYRDYSKLNKINEALPDELCSIKGTIKSLYIRRGRGMSIVNATIFDETGQIQISWFNQRYIQNVLKKGDTIIITGKIKVGTRGGKSISSPDYEIIGDNNIHTNRIIPIYYEPELNFANKKKKIKSKWFREKIYILLDYCNQINDYLPNEIKQKFKLIDLKEAIRQIHFPENIEKLNKAKHRLAFDELFFLQLVNAQTKNEWKTKESNIKIKIDKNKLKADIKTLPFKLTKAQINSINEIINDINSEQTMIRLLQGDVGSGKTIVAFLIANRVVNNNYQVAIMAPTEILAKQHYANYIKQFKDSGYNIQLITGNTGAKEKRELKKQISTGTVDVVIGTHALIQKDINFNKLGLAIIDEQHRFGVNQRKELCNPNNPNLLNMTATPIPRSLALSIYGDQDISIIDELPEGRKEIITRIVPEKKRNDAEIWINNQIDSGRQVFVVCPLIEESEVLEVKSATDEYERLKKEVFKNRRIGLIHGRLKQEEKDNIMLSFKNKEIDILVATSVIEVGIDIPNANIIIIEGSERFGLSQLHQFRGRVGRGEYQSYCFLFTQSYSVESRKRLQAMVKHSSGFIISEIDLELRGPGEVYGVKQSGIPDLKIAKLNDTELIKQAKRAAERIIEINEDLSMFSLLKEEFRTYLIKRNEEFNKV